MSWNDKRLNKDLINIWTIHWIFLAIDDDHIPTQLNNGSFLHWFEQPSPLAKFMSSHCSPRYLKGIKTKVIKIVKSHQWTYCHKAVLNKYQNLNFSQTWFKTAVTKISRNKARFILFQSVNGNLVMEDKDAAYVNNLTQTTQFNEPFC